MTTNATTPAADAVIGHNGGPEIELQDALDLGDAASPSPDPYAARTSPETLGLVRTFRLCRPLVVKGQALAEITVREPEQHDLAALQRAAQKDGAVIGSLALLASLAGVPQDALGGLLERDHGPIKAWIEELIDDAADGDPAPDPEAPGLQTWECVLLSPIPTDTKPILAVSLREPDVAVGIATEKFRHEAEQTAAMIAQLTGLTIPIVNRMKRRDVLRIERWLRPFSQRGQSSKKRARMLAALLQDLGLSEALEAGD